MRLTVAIQFFDSLQVTYPQALFPECMACWSLSVMKLFAFSGEGALSETCSVLVVVILFFVLQSLPVVYLSPCATKIIITRERLHDPENDFMGCEGASLVDILKIKK